MTTDTVLTTEFIADALTRHDDNLLKFARAIEQAVLQSPEVQRLREDAGRYREVRRMSLREFSDIYEANVQTGAPFDRLVDAAMEKQP